MLSVCNNESLLVVQMMTLCARGIRESFFQLDS